MSPSTYFLSSAAWSFAGLVVGYFAGLLTAARFAPRSTGDQPVLPRTRPDRILGVLVLVLSVISIATAAITIGRQSDLVACQAQFNRDFAAATGPRTDAAKREREAQRVLLTGTFTNPQEWAEAKATYLREVDAADAMRDAHPYPAPPAC